MNYFTLYLTGGRTGHPSHCIFVLLTTDAIWWNRSGSTLAQIMACCQTAPGDGTKLNQCWLLVSEAHEGTFGANTGSTDNSNVFENLVLKITSTSPRCQCVKLLALVSSQTSPSHRLPDPEGSGQMLQLLQWQFTWHVNSWSHKTAKHYLKHRLGEYMLYYKWLHAINSYRLGDMYFYQWLTVNWALFQYIFFPWFPLVLLIIFIQDRSDSNLHGACEPMKSLHNFSTDHAGSMTTFNDLSYWNFHWSVKPMGLEISERLHL